MNINNNNYSSHALFLHTSSNEDGAKRPHLPIENKASNPHEKRIVSHEQEKAAIPHENIADVLKANQRKGTSKMDYLMVYKIAPNSKVVSVQYELADKTSLRI